MIMIDNNDREITYEVCASMGMHASAKVMYMNPNTD